MLCKTSHDRSDQHNDCVETNVITKRNVTVDCSKKVGTKLLNEMENKKVIKAVTREVIKSHLQPMLFGDKESVKLSSHTYSQCCWGQGKCGSSQI